MGVFPLPRAEQQVTPVHEGLNGENRVLHRENAENGGRRPGLSFSMRGGGKMQIVSQIN